MRAHAYFCSKSPVHNTITMSDRHSNTEVNVIDHLSSSDALETLKFILKADEITPEFICQLQILRKILGTPAAAPSLTHISNSIHDLETRLKRQDKKIMRHRKSIDDE
jgi:hypothetical protein